MTDTEPTRIDPYRNFGFWKRIYGSGWESWLDWLSYRFFRSGRVVTPKEKEEEKEAPARLVKHIMDGTDVVETRDVGGMFTGVALSEAEPLASFWATGYSEQSAADEVFQLAVDWFKAISSNAEDYIPKIEKMWGVIWDGRVGPFNGHAAKIVSHRKWRLRK